jgi:hypothetical protein
MKTFTIALLAALLPLPLMAQPTGHAAKPVVLKPSKPLEKCFQMDAGQKIEYRFDAAKKINFELNYRVSAEQVYRPVKLDRTLGESGLFEARSRNKYCLVWENRTDADVELNYVARTGR